MKPVFLRDCDAVLGRRQGFDPLPIRRDTMVCSVRGQQSVITSEWELSLADIQKIIDGGRIRLIIQGISQPPVILEVTDPGEDLSA